MTTTDKEHEFWVSDHRYESLVRKYERNIERKHPPYVTSDGMCVCLEYTSWCSWAATSVDYYEYNGPRPTSTT